MKIGTKVKARKNSTMAYVDGKLIAIDTGGKKGAWYEIQPADKDLPTFKCRAANVTAL